MVDVKTCLDNAQEKMDMAIMYLEEALAHIRAGKASARLLDGIRVDSYGSMVPISNVAAITTPDARSIVIKPWDKSMFRKNLRGYHLISVHSLFRRGYVPVLLPDT